MIIIQKPKEINFSGNLPDFIIESDEMIAVELFKGSNSVMTEDYYPDDSDRIYIRFKEVIDNLLFSTIPDPTSPLHIQESSLDDFKLVINDDEEIDFKVIKGGLDTTQADVALWLQSNFLTWQPQIKNVMFYDPEWLTYYAPDGVSVVKLKGYFSDNTNQTIDLLTLTAEKVQSINLNPGTIKGKFTKDLMAYDVWVQKGANKLTWPQRYIFTDEYFLYNDLFIFENSLSGIDTIRFTGQAKVKPDNLVQTAKFDESTFDYFLEPKTIISKNTGLIRSERDKLWAMDFFNSLNRHVLRSGAIKPITISKPKIEAIKGELVDFEFDYSLSTETKYLNLSRPNYLPNDLIF